MWLPRRRMATGLMRQTSVCYGLGQVCMYLGSSDATSWQKQRSTASGVRFADLRWVMTPACAAVVVSAAGRHHMHAYGAAAPPALYDAVNKQCVGHAKLTAFGAGALWHHVSYTTAVS